MMSLTGLATIAVLAVAAGALAWGAFVDIRRYTIPNLAAATVAIAFLPMAALMPLNFLIGGLLAGLGVFAVGVLIFARGWMGGGDVKLLAATCLWAGPSMLAPFALVTSIAAGALGLLMLSPIGRHMPAHPSATIDDTRPMGRQPMPFGVAIAVGGLWVILQHFTAIR